MTEPICCPFRLTLEEFLAGPERTADDLDIDRIFATPLQRLLEENPSDELSYDTQSPIWPCQLNPDLRYVEVEAGVLLLDAGSKIIGAYIWTSLAVDEAWQGQGLGADIVIQRIERWGENPVWNLDVPAYSPAGRAAHESAWHRKLWEYKQNEDQLEPRRDYRGKKQI